MNKLFVVMYTILIILLVASYFNGKLRVLKARANGNYQLLNAHLNAQHGMKLPSYKKGLIK